MRTTVRKFVPLLNGGLAIYFTRTPASGVYRAPLSGGPAELLYETNSVSLGLMGDESYVYATLRYDDAVVQIPKAGGAATVLAHNQTGPLQIAQDDNCVYWINSYSQANKNGRVMRASKQLP